MGAHGKEFLDMRMYKEDYDTLDKKVTDKIEVKTVDIEDFDYSHDDIWKDLKTKSNKAYKALKNREFELRHGK